MAIIYRMADRRWTVADVPDQSGRTAVVTGGAAGIGFETAKVLAVRGARVVLACRDAERGAAATNLLTGDVVVVRLDLASLASVRAAADEIRAAVPRLDLLINNAGVMNAPFRRTEDGIELTFATNHVGHFALTGLLLDTLTDDGRIVTVSSIAHRRGTADFSEPDAASYQPDEAYARSKLANLLFTYELDRRLAGSGIHALAAHPGVVGTALWRTSSAFERVMVSNRLRALNFWLAQDAAAGALPSLRAATDPDARGGDYFGPHRWQEMTGAPVRVQPIPLAHDEAAQRRLWELSEGLTGVHYPLPAG
jgi:NAD(P)-dependent dehydrogenase (short-subunit alcohol dehydrogenase family)